MQIVIDLPNSLYANLKKIKGDSVAGKRIIDCVINGTPVTATTLATEEAKPNIVESMTNADKFKAIFGIYATELWAKSEKDFLEWLNAPTIIEADNTGSEG